MCWNYYNTFINEDILDCYFDYEQAVLLRNCGPRKSEMITITSQKNELLLVSEEKVAAPSIPKIVE